MDAAITIPPPPEPVRHDWQWWRTQFLTYWTPLDAKSKWIYPSAFLLVSITVSRYIWRFNWGLLYYFYEYIAAACGHDMLTESCAGIMRELHPWWDLSDRDFYRWNRCFGNEDGFRRQGEMLPSFGRMAGLVMNPFDLSLWIVSVVIYLPRHGWTNFR
jgi:hypothetical protein